MRRMIAGRLPARHSEDYHVMHRQQHEEKWHHIRRVSHRLYLAHASATVLATAGGWEAAESHKVAGAALLIGAIAVHYTGRSVTRDLMNDMYVMGRNDESAIWTHEQALEDGQNSGDTVQ